MENEIANCLLRCETPILPPDVIMGGEDQEIPPKQETVESSEDRMKRKKLKRRQHFMRVHLKKQRETMNIVNPTPSTIPNILDNAVPYSRENHQHYVQHHNTLEEIKTDIVEGKSKEELHKLAEEQAERLRKLKEENYNLRESIFRMKKQLYKNVRT